MTTQPRERVQACIDACLACYRTSRAMASTHCLQRGGRHVAPPHFRLMLDCAEICRTAAEFMLNASAFAAHVCAVCAEVCEACAASCERLDDMQPCVDACRRCAETCREMARET